MKFIKATEAHFPEIVNLVSSPEELYLLFPSGHYPLDKSQLRTIFEARTNVTVGMINGQVAAFANFYNVRPGKLAFIGNVIVSEAYKGQGMGKAITQHMMNQCRTLFDAEPHLSVFGFNTRALLMYTNLGFKPYAVEPRTNLQGETVALIHMRTG